MGVFLDVHRDKVKGVLGCFEGVLVLRQWMVQNGEPMRKRGVSQQPIAVEYGCGRMQWVQMRHQGQA